MSKHKQLLPDIIIVGAPKCGTTSLFHYLADHPLIIPSNVKETCFLNDQDYPLFKKDRNFFKDGLDGYSAFFDNRKSFEKLFMEATPDYLYQKNPLMVLKTFPCKPHIIILLRKPSARIYSLFIFAQNNMGVLDSKITFTQFLDKVWKNELPAKKTILRDCITHSKYYIYIDEWFQCLGKEKIHIVLFEDLKNEPVKTMKKIAGQMGIEQNFYDTYLFTVKNKTVNIKHHNLHKMKKRMASYLPDNTIRIYLKKLYKKINYRRSLPIKSKEDIKSIKDLDDYFIDYNQKLVDLTGLSLVSWD